MHRLLLAFRAFFRILFNRALAEQIEPLLIAGPGAPPAEPKPAPKPKPPPKPAAPARSEALTLLASLQREARFVDFLRESLDDYADAQVGAAARDVHRGCAAVVERFFALRPLVDGEEGKEIEVPGGFDPGRFRLTGNVAGSPPFRGRIVHHGWEATACNVPEWTGGEAAARVVAPAEVELP